MPFVSKWESVWEAGECKAGYHCRFCPSTAVEFREWESSDGGHEDIQYRCMDCHRKWWVEGIDS